MYAQILYCDTSSPVVKSVYQKQFYFPTKTYVVGTQYRLRTGGGREAQPNMEETCRERLPWVEAHDSWPARKEHLEIRCEIRYACS